MIQAQNFIAGGWTKSAGQKPDVNPSNTNDVIGEFPQAAAGDVETAIAAAKAAFPAWSRSSIQLRHDILKRIGDEILARKDEIGRLLAREEGKTLAEGIGETVRAGQIFLFFSGEALRLAGEKLAFGASRHRCRDDARAAGRHRPHHALEFPDRHSGLEDRAGVGLWQLRGAEARRAGARHRSRAAEIIARAGLPAGVFNLVMGRGSVVGEAMLRHKDVAGISFTGSVATGRRMAATCIESEPMKKLQLEMGGKNPLVVLDDADLKNAVECAVNGAFFQTGQRCTASSRLIVTEKVHDSFVTAMAERMKTLVIGDALKEGTQIGPVVDQSQLDQDLGYIRIGQDEGAKLLAGGERLNRETPALSGAGLVHRGGQQDAHRAGGDLRAGGDHHPGQGLRRGPGGRQ